MSVKIVIGIVGMPGAGKNTIREVARKFGFPIVVMGDEVRAEAKRRNLDPTPENLGKIMLQLREDEGPGALANRCIPRIAASNFHVVLVDGVRSMREVEEFRKAFPRFKVVAIHASPKTRFERLLRRGRSDDPKNWETFVERDLRELRVGIGEVIAIADHMVLNEGTTDDFRRKLRRLFGQMIENEQGGKSRGYS